MTVTTNVTDDPRVYKEAVSLANTGNSVEVIGIKKTGNELKHQTKDAVRITRVDLWYSQIVRLMKNFRGQSVTQEYFVNDEKDPDGLSLQVRRYLIKILHQLEYLLHIASVFIVFSYYLSFDFKEKKVIHAHDVDTLLPAIFVGWLTETPVVYDAHECWHEKQKDKIIINTVNRTIERLFLPQCAHVFTVNDTIANLMTNRYFIEKPTVLLNVPVYVPKRTPEPLGDHERIKLLYHGGFQIDRGLENLIEAMKFVDHPTTLALRGFGELEPVLFRQVKQMGLEDRVNFAPVVSMEQLIPTSFEYHVGILPFVRNSSYKISLPNKLFEYMAAGLAILSNNLPEIVSIVEKHKIGRIYDSEDPKKIAEDINLLIGNRELLESYRFRAWRIYRKYYSWEQHKHVLMDVYEKV